MLRKIIVLTGIFISCQIHAQQNFEQLLLSGIEDTKTFARSYISPGAESLMYTINSGWFKTAATHKFLGFDISLIGAAHFVEDSDQSFDMNVNDFQNIRFPDGSTSKKIATVFGDNNPNQTVIVTLTENGFSEDVEILLPDGVASENIDVLPAAFLQAELGIFKGTDLKVRYIPEFTTEDVETGLYGLGIQHELTSWLPLQRLLPINVAVLGAYTHLNSEFDFSGKSALDGQNQKLELDMDTWLFQLIASTKLPIINFYGGVGYITGDSDFDLKGTYEIQSNILSQPRVLTDPFSVSNSVSGARATVGANLKIAFFEVNAEYHFQEYNALSVGVHFGIR
jgi:hypothetical protein